MNEKTALEKLQEAIERGKVGVKLIDCRRESTVHQAKIKNVIAFIALSKVDAQGNKTGFSDYHWLCIYDKRKFSGRPNGIKYDWESLEVGGSFEVDINEGQSVHLRSINLHQSWKRAAKSGRVTGRITVKASWDKKKLTVTRIE